MKGDDKLTTYSPEELGRALLDAFEGNQSHASAALGTSRAQFMRLLSGADCKWSTLQRVAEELGKARGGQVRVRLVMEEEAPVEPGTDRLSAESGGSSAAAGRRGP